MAKIKETLEKVIVVHLGIRQGLIDDQIFKAVISEIIKNHNKLTLQDIEHAYNRFDFTQKRDTWKNVTKSDVMQPIIEWHNVRHKIADDFKKYKDDQLELLDQERKANEFHIECVNLYNECVDNLEWIGTIFQASNVAPIVAKSIDQDVKDQLWNVAKEEMRKINQHNAELKRLGMLSELDISSIGKSDIRIYSELIVKRGIMDGIKIE